MCFKLANTHNDFLIIKKFNLQLISFKVVDVSLFKILIKKCMNLMTTREAKVLVKVLFKTKNLLLSIKLKL